MSRFGGRHHARDGVKVRRAIRYPYTNPTPRPWIGLSKAGFTKQQMNIIAKFIEAWFLSLRGRLCRGNTEKRAKLNTAKPITPVRRRAWKKELWTPVDRASSI